MQYVAKSFAIGTVWGEAAVGFTEGADQHIPIPRAEFCISAALGVIKSDPIHDEFPHTGEFIQRLQRA